MAEKFHSGNVDTIGKSFTKNISNNLPMDEFWIIYFLFMYTNIVSSFYVATTTQEFPHVQLTKQMLKEDIIKDLNNVKSYFFSENQKN